VAMCMPVLFFCVEQCSRIGGVVPGSQHRYVAALRPSPANGTLGGNSAKIG
jgi:hypothetical protein